MLQMEEYCSFKLISINYSTQEMDKILCTVLLLLSIFNGLAQDSCTPLWPRVQFGNIYADYSNGQKMIIKFNTRSLCQRSYVTLATEESSIRKVFCESKSLRLSENMGNYEIFLQRCSISQIQFQQRIGYIAYGSNQTSRSIPFSSYPLQTRMLHPNSTKTTKMINLADWAQLNKNPNAYKSINQTLDALRVTQQVNALMINGDIAYNLDTDNGANYEDFLNILSRVGKHVPVFLNTGNHEHISEDDMKIFYFTFEQYGKEKNLATGLSLGPLYLIGFDPYEIVYLNNLERNLKRQTWQVLESQAYVGLKQKIQEGKSTNKILVTSSHYPFICSAPDKKCQTDKYLLKDFFDLMLDNDIKLYLGAHVHTYERILPYCQNDTFIVGNQGAQFNLVDDKCFISVIQGTAGNDYKMVERYDSIQFFTAAYTYAQTGVGLVEVTSDSIKYRHFSSQNVVTLKDEFDISFKGKNNKQIYLQE